MESNIYRTYESIRRLKNKIHKKLYNKNRSYRENLINELSVLSNSLSVVSIAWLVRYFTRKVLFTINELDVKKD